MNRYTQRRWAPAAGAVVMAASASALGVPPGHTVMYELRDLGSLGGSKVEAVAMNDQGTAVVGWAQTLLDRTTHAFVWTERTGMLDLGTLGGVWAEARHVNEAGQVVGAARTADGQMHAFYAYGGRMYDLNDLLPMAPAGFPTGDRASAASGAAGRAARGNPFVSFTDATAINDEGLIVGSGFVQGSQEPHGFLLVPLDAGLPVPEYTCLDLGVLAMAGDCIPTDVNGRGQVVGVSGGHAFIWNKRIEPLDDFARLVLWQSQANAINGAGTVAGWYVEGGPQTACVWSAGVRSDLVFQLGYASAANGINDKEQVVGWSEVPADEGGVDVVRIAVLWEGAEAINLNDVTAVPLSEVMAFPWSWLEEAVSIDAHGCIAGFGCSTDGRVRAFMLEPVAAVK